MQAAPMPYRFYTGRGQPFRQMPEAKISDSGARSRI
jgi:hypothetical protein